MEVFLGVDLGSTTSKAIVVTQEGQILGRGITNTRSNYRVAAEIAREEAIHNARLSYLVGEMETRGFPSSRHAAAYSDLDLGFRFEGHLRRLAALEAQCRRTLASLPGENGATAERLGEIFAILGRDAYHTFDTQAPNDTSNATASAPTPSSPGPGRSWTSAGRTPRRSRSTATASSPPST